MGAAEGRTSTRSAGSTKLGASGQQSVIRVIRGLGGCIPVIIYKSILCCCGNCCCRTVNLRGLVGLCQGCISCSLGGRPDLCTCGSLCRYYAASPRLRHDRPRGRSVRTPLRGNICSLVGGRLGPRSPEQLVFACVGTDCSRSTRYPMFGDFLGRVARKGPRLRRHF